MPPQHCSCHSAAEEAPGAGSTRRAPSARLRSSLDGLPRVAPEALSVFVASINPHRLWQECWQLYWVPKKKERDMNAAPTLAASINSAEEGILWIWKGWNVSDAATYGARPLAHLHQEAQGRSSLRRGPCPFSIAQLVNTQLPTASFSSQLSSQGSLRAHQVPWTDDAMWALGFCQNAGKWPKERNMHGSPVNRHAEFALSKCWFFRINLHGNVSSRPLPFFSEATLS